MRKRLKAYAGVLGAIMLLSAAFFSAELLPPIAISTWHKSHGQAFVIAWVYEILYIYFFYYYSIWLLQQVNEKRRTKLIQHPKYRLDKWSLVWFHDSLVATKSFLKSDRFITRLIRFLTINLYIIALFFSGLIPWMLKFGLIACIVRKKVSDCPVLVLGSGLKLFLITWYGKEIADSLHMMWHLFF